MAGFSWKISTNRAYIVSYWKSVIFRMLKSRIWWSSFSSGGCTVKKGIHTGHNKNALRQTRHFSFRTEALFTMNYASCSQCHYIRLLWPMWPAQHWSRVPLVCEVPNTSLCMKYFLKPLCIHEDWFINTSRIQQHKKKGHEDKQRWSFSWDFTGPVPDTTPIR